MQLRLHASKTIARPAVPRARAADLPGFRIRPRVHRQPVPDRQRAAQRRGALRILFRAATSAFTSPASTRGSTIRSRRPPSSPAAASCAPASPTRRRPTLYGAEIEVQAYLPLDRPRRPLLRHPPAALHRQLHLHPVGDQRRRFASSSARTCSRSPPTSCSRDGAPLTGQSDHLANLQIGIEDTDSLSQATFLLTYASERVTNRGPIQGLLRQPDIVERPGLRLDFVLRQEVPIFGVARRVQVRGAQPHRPGL